MEEIAWTDDFSVGVAALDAQHKKLIGMINRLIRDPSAETRSETISDLLTEMTRYAQKHFQAEETLMSEHGYPGLDSQKQQHQAFRRKTVDLCSATMARVQIVPDVMLNYLREWLVDHILREDMKYKPFFAQRGVY
jgi:hemerythrin-like metal-binding protein